MSWLGVPISRTFFSGRDVEGWVWPNLVWRIVDGHNMAWPSHQVYDGWICVGILMVETISWMSNEE